MIHKCTISYCSPQFYFIGFVVRKKEYVPYFSEEGDLVFCINVPGLMLHFNIHSVYLKE